MRLTCETRGAGGLRAADPSAVTPNGSDAVTGAKERFTAPSSAAAFAGIYLFTLLLYVRPSELFPDLFDFPITKIVGIFALVVYLLSRIARGESLTLWSIETKMLTLLILLGVLFMPLAASPGDSYKMLSDVFLKVATIFVLIINVVDSPRRLTRILGLVVLCGTAIAADAMRAYAQGRFMMKVAIPGTRIEGIVGGLFGNPNDLAIALVILVPIAVALAVLRRGLARLAYAACAVALIGGVGVTFSRGGFLGLVAIGAVLMWKIGRARRVVTAISFAVLLLVFVMAMPAGYVGRVATILDTNSDPTGSAQERREILERAVDIAVHHPIVGVGMGNFHIYSIRERAAHNAYLEIAAELGMGGLLAYLVLIAAPMRALLRVEREILAVRNASSGSPRERTDFVYYLDVSLQASFAGYIVCSAFASIQYYWFLYYLVAYAVCLRRIHVSGLLAGGPAAKEAGEGGPRGAIWSASAGGRGVLVASRHRPRYV